jgi:hypothetical protein
MRGSRPRMTYVETRADARIASAHDVCGGAGRCADRSPRMTYAGARADARVASAQTYAETRAKG